MARCPESWFAGATSGQAPQFLSDTNDTETTWHSTLRQLLWRKDWKFKLFCHWAIAVSGEPQISSKPTGVPRKRKSDFCHTPSETWQKYVEKTWNNHALPPSPRLREGRGCSDTPSTTNSRESASEAKPWLFSDGNWGECGGNISRICSMVNYPNLAKLSMQTALEVGNEMKSTWFHFWQLRCPHLSSFKPSSWY